MTKADIQGKWKRLTSRRPVLLRTFENALDVPGPAVAERSHPKETGS
jgi:hypothetical protein